MEKAPVENLDRYSVCPIERSSTINMTWNESSYYEIDTLLLLLDFSGTRVLALPQTSAAGLFILSKKVKVNYSEIS